MFESYTFNNHNFEIRHKVDSDGITVKVFLNNTQVGYEYFCSADGLSSQDGNSSLELLKTQVKSDIQNGIICF
ncbi:hypothetical protein L5M36_03290 [Shewanella sp. SM72]|uniref:hypothetical protein n=1 Tax=Shewanella sp. SM72 TaxID=2912805 RepID=UPI0021DAA9E2|nr:hypothetical protein [Shewanella sp. SM72]MCU8015923.1 hypothetical protein [Shewanella sp. SM72]